MMRPRSRLALGALLAGCVGAASRPGIALRPRRYAFVVLRRGGPRGRARDHDRARVPGDRIRRRRCADGRARAAGDDPAAADAQRARAVEAFRVSRARLREGHSCRRDAARRFDDRALPLPKANPQRIVVIGDTGCRISRRPTACSRRATTRRSGRSPPLPPRRPPPRRTSSSTSATTTIARTNARPGNAQCAGSPWGYGWDAWEADLFAPGAKCSSRAAPWIVVRGNHESCSSRGAGLVAIPRSASARAAAGLQRRRRRCDRRLQRAVRRAAGFGRRLPTPSSSCSIRRSWASRRFPPTDPMHVRYRAQLERAFALAARRPNTFFMNHHPILAFAPNPARPDAPYPGQRRAAIRARGLAADRAVSAERQGAPCPVTSTCSRS